MPYAPTFYGFIPETQDALLLFQAVIQNKLPLVTSRPPDNERANMIRSGAVYIFKEGSIKRWTDKVCWSPSRVLGNFLVYRELNSKRGLLNHGPSHNYDDPQRTRVDPVYNAANRGRNVEFSLYGSLVDSYDFKEDGLIKKTISTTYGNETYRLISYYTVKDVMSNSLLSPMDFSSLVDIEVDSRLATGIEFQMPLHTINMEQYAIENDALKEGEDGLAPLESLNPTNAHFDPSGQPHYIMDMNPHPDPVQGGYEYNEVRYHHPNPVMPMPPVTYYNPSDLF